jgi:hypothetical protein
MNPFKSVILCIFFMSFIMIYLKLLSCFISSPQIIIRMGSSCSYCNFFISVLGLTALIIYSLFIIIIVIINLFLLSVSLLYHVNNVIFLLIIILFIYVFINLFVSLLLSFVNVHSRILIFMIVLIGIIIMM